ncbi:Redoxin [Hyaloraphidium curvatum]|nr:Redoxin [Hyaloraphidium curvatum]
MIAVGDQIPEATLMISGNQNDGQDVCSTPKAVKTRDFFKGKRTVLFAVPGAFTPLCHIQHLPSFLKNYDSMKAKGIDQIACVSVNDIFVMHAWGRAEKVGDKITMLADGSGEFVKKLGLAAEIKTFGLRSQRWAMIVDDGVVKYVGVDPKGLEKSGGEAVLAKL